MTDRLDAVNVWLAILALVSLAEFLMILTAAFIGYRLYRRATATMDRLEADYIAPITAKVNTVVANVRDLTERLQRADEKVHAVIGRVEEAAGRVAIFARRAWPVIGTWRAVGAAVTTLLSNNHPTERSRPVSRPMTTRRTPALDSAGWRTH